jgi:hypothetical protein
MKKILTLILLLFISTCVLSQKQKKQKIYGYEIMGVSNLYLSEEREPTEFNFTPLYEGKMCLNLTNQTILIDYNDNELNFNIIEVYGRDRMEILFMCVDDEDTIYEIRMRETEDNIFFIVDDGKYYIVFSLEED